MLTKCLLLLTFVGTVYCGVVLPSPPPGCYDDGITYAVGEEMPSHPCQPCHCSESGPVCGSVGCPPLRCPPHHSLVEEKVFGECCPNRTCVPVTCEMDGVTYKGGELIPDDNPCIKCLCTESGPVCGSVGCPTPQ